MQWATPTAGIKPLSLNHCNWQGDCHITSQHVTTNIPLEQQWTCFSSREPSTHSQTCPFPRVCQCRNQTNPKFASVLPFQHTTRTLQQTVLCYWTEEQLPGCLARLAIQIKNKKYLKFDVLRWISRTDTIPYCWSGPLLTKLRTFASLASYVSSESSVKLTFFIACFVLHALKVMFRPRPTLSPWFGLADSPDW